MSVDGSKLTVPIGAVAGLCMMGLSYWVNAQDTRITSNTDDIADIREGIANDKLQIQGKINDVRTTQEVQITKQQAIFELLERLERKVDNLPGN